MSVNEEKKTARVAPVVRRNKRSGRPIQRRTFAQTLQKRWPKALETLSRDAEHLMHHKIAGAEAFAKTLEGLQINFSALLAAEGLAELDFPPRVMRANIRQPGEKVYLVDRAFLAAKAMYGESVARGPWEFVKSEDGHAVFRSTLKHECKTVAGKRQSIEDESRAAQAHADLCRRDGAA